MATAQRSPRFYGFTQAGSSTWVQTIGRRQFQIQEEEPRYWVISERVRGRPVKLGAQLDVEGAVAMVLRALHFKTSRRGGWGSRARSR